MHSSIYVISGSILDSDHNGFRDNDKDYNRCGLYFYEFCHITSYHRWTSDKGSVAIPTQFYSIAIQCKNKSFEISSCLVEDIQALGIVMYHNEINKVRESSAFIYMCT